MVVADANFRLPMIRTKVADEKLATGVGNHRKPA